MTETLRLDSLPFVTSSRARSTRAPWQWTCATQTTATVVLAGLGLVRVSCDGFDESTPASREELVLVGRDGRRGRITVDRWFALAVVAATLGSRTPRVLRSLGRAEKGVLAGHVAGALAQRGYPVAVSLNEPRCSDDPRSVSLTLRVETNGITGHVRLEVPPEWLAPRDGSEAESDRLRETLRAAAGRLPISLSVERAVTELGASEWARARRGDTVLFTEHPFLTTSEWPVSLRLGDHAADAITNDQGHVSVAGPFRSVPPRARLPLSFGLFFGGVSVTRASLESGAGIMSARADDHALTAISAAPIEIVAEVGRVTLRGDEVLALQPGSVLALGHHGQVVNLVVGGRSWARGELVNVDGEIGVRIIELAAL